jgi:hypothetical protein
LAAETLVLNKSAFTGDPITEETDTASEKFQKTAGYALKSWLPSAPWIPGSWYWDKIKNAATGATDARRRDLSVPMAILNSVGVKARWQDVEEGLYFRNLEHSQAVSSLRAEARALAKRREQNKINQREFESGMAAIVLKIERVKEAVEQLNAVSKR